MKLKKSWQGGAIFTAGAILGTGLAFGYSAYDTARHENVAYEVEEPSAVPLSWEVRMQQARDARLALAERYSRCVITNVVDMEASKTNQVSEVTDAGITITVRASITPEATAAERAYASDALYANDVLWSPFGSGALASTLQADPANPGAYSRSAAVPSTSTAEKTGANTETFTVKLHPGENAGMTEVSLVTQTETYNENTGNGTVETYKAAGRVSCGTVYPAAADNLEGSGVATWDFAPGPAAGIESYTISEQTCVYTPDLGTQCN